MICNFAAWRPITANYEANGMLPDIRGFVPHVQVGTGSLQRFFSNPSTRASAHFWISKTGQLEQYLDTSDMAWAEGAGNPHFWSCEFEGQVDEPMTSQQLDTGGRLIAWLYQLHNFPLVVNQSPDGQGITPHFAGGAAWGGHSCPGSLRFQQYQDLILAALRWLDDAPPASHRGVAPASPPGDEYVPTEAEWNDLMTRVTEIQESLGHLLGLNPEPNSNLRASIVETRDNVRKVVTKLGAADVRP